MENLPRFDYGGPVPLTEEEYSSRKKTIKRIWPHKVGGIEGEEIIFSAERIEAVRAFQEELPQLLSDPKQPELKSLYNTLFDELGIPIEERDPLLEHVQSLSERNSLKEE